MFQNNLWYKRTLFFAILALLSTITYSNSFQNSFHYDDFHSIVENFFIRNISAVPDYFTSSKFFSGTISHTGSYRPILLTTYAVNYYFGKLEPFGYHLVNLAIHILMSVMVFIVARHFFKDDLRSVWSALLFALNPFNSEVVNYISSRSSSLSSLFFVLAFYFYILFRQKSGFGWVKYFLYMFFFIASLLVKVSAIMLPAVVIIYDLLYIRNKVSIKKLILPHSPIFIVGLYGMIVMPVESNPVLSFIVNMDKNKLYPVATSLVIIFDYLRLFFFPVGLVLDRNVVVNNENLTIIIIPLIAVVGLLVALFRYRSNRNLLFIFLWFFITLFPMLCMPFIFEASLFQDSRGYLSSVTLSFLFGMALSTVSRKKQFFIAVPLLLLCMVGSYKRNMVWTDEFSLWTDVAAKDDTSYMAHHSLAIAYQEKGEHNKAIGEYKKALERDPTYYLSYYNLSKLYLDNGEIEKAMEHNSFVLKLKANYDKAHYLRGYMMMLQGKYDEAVASFNTAILHNPNNLKSYLSLGYIYQGKKMLDKAAENYLILLKYDSEEVEALSNLGLIYMQQGKTEQAERYLLESLKVKPDFLNARMNLAGLYRNQKKYDASIVEYDNVIGMKKDFAEAYFFKGLVLQKQEKYKRAIKNYRESIKLGIAQNNSKRYQWLIADARQRIASLEQ